MSDLCVESPAAPPAALRILVVEDDDDSRELMATLLATAGADTLALASTGEDGLERMRREAYDLVVTDIGLPGMLGLEMLDHAKAEGLLCRTTLVVCSANEGVAAQVARRGATFVRKPVHAEKILDLVHRCRAAASTADPA